MDVYDLFKFIGRMLTCKTTLKKPLFLWAKKPLGEVLRYIYRIKMESATENCIKNAEKLL